MHLSLASTVLFAALANAAAVSEAAVSAQVHYDGTKVVRLEVGRDVDRVKDMVSRLSLSSWSGRAEADKTIDLVVPAGKAAEFAESTSDMKTELMHEDLGASIAAERAFQRYARRFIFPRQYRGLD